MPIEHIWTVSDFVIAFNQTLEFSYPSTQIEGEIANFRISKNQWVYFDLKDDDSSVKFFGSVYVLPGPLEDGMKVLTTGCPRLHPQYGFSVNLQSIRPVGEGTIKKAAALLQAKLTAEGLFDDSRKRPLVYPPKKIGLITSVESAAFSDFNKILNSRWGGIEIDFIDVLVQGENSSEQIIAAINYFNFNFNDLEVLVIIRGGGSADDLQVFSSEQVTRAVATSRIPTLVAIGHESDFSLAELAADKRASTPSNAAELLVPDKLLVLQDLKRQQQSMISEIKGYLQRDSQYLNKLKSSLDDLLRLQVKIMRERTERISQVLKAMNPSAAVRRGYAILSIEGTSISSVKQVKVGNKMRANLRDGSITAKITGVSKDF